MQRVKILLADYHAMVLESILKVLEEHYEIVGRVEDGRALLEAAKELTPDVVIPNIPMPLLNG